MSQPLLKCLNDEIRRNQSLIKKIRAGQRSVRAGRLEKQTHGKQTYFYLAYKENGKRMRKCLGNAHSEKVKEYIGELNKAARVELLINNNQAIEELKIKLREDTVEGVRSRLPETCRELSREGFVDARLEELKAWARAEYKRNTSHPEHRIHSACDGTLVRSKGEVIWYNLLYSLGIPFRYEPVIQVKDDMNRTVERAPDFLIQCYDGSFIIIEHLGVLNDPAYGSVFAAKCRYYLKAGFVLGVNFFVTSDNTEGATNSDAIDKIVRLVEQRFYGI